MIEVLQMKEWFLNFMRGRYGADQLGRFLSVVSLIIFFVGMIIGNTLGRVLWYLAIACLIYTYYRMFSRNTYKRYQENLKYLQWKNHIMSWFRRQKDMLTQRKTHRFFKCSQCGITVRVPKGKGKIKITCPKCGNTFIKKT